MTSGESSRDQEGPESMHCDLCMRASCLHQMDLNCIALIEGMLLHGLLLVYSRTSQTGFSRNNISVRLFQEFPGKSALGVALGTYAFSYSCTYT